MNDGALREVADLVRAETGIEIKDAQLPALAAAIGRVERGLDAKELLTRAQTPHSPVLGRLVDEVTVQETYFFRELRELQAIDWRGLLDRAREGGGGGLRVWVAACATGEEAYSLAILASEALGPDSRQVSILATDVSAAALRRAEAGSDYSARSVRNLPPGLRERYLTERDGRHAVRESLRAMVRFRHHNLVTDPAPPLGEVPFDLIACRNVLIYFDPVTVERVVASLEGALRPEGSLVLGAADRLIGTAGRLRRSGDVAVAARREPRPGKRALRRPLGLEPRSRSDDRIEDALLAADDGDLERAASIVSALLAADPSLVDAHFVKGLVELEAGEARAATSSLRRCLYLDPSFGLAAFELGRAHDALGDARAARRAYGQALRSLDASDERHRAILDQVDLGDIAAACEARLGAEGSGRR